MSELTDPVKKPSVGPLLYIDDDALALRSLTALLQTLGYSVRAVSDAADALRVFDQDDFSLVITDMNMPTMNGLQLTQSIKQSRPGTPVIVISGIDELDLRGISSHERPDCILEKPLALDELKSELLRLT